MTLGHDPDRLIDQALAEAVSGEPRRVNAASVRRALAGPSRSPLPIWLAVAAMLLIALALRLRESPAESASTAASGRTPTLIPGSTANPPAVTAVREPEATVVERHPRGATASAPRHRAEPAAPVRAAAVEPPFEGLPRLIVPVLDRPATLVPAELDASALTIAALEIQPLSSPALSTGQDH